MLPVGACDSVVRLIDVDPRLGRVGTGVGWGSSVGVIGSWVVFDPVVEVVKLGDAGMGVVVLPVAGKAARGAGGGVTEALAWLSARAACAPACK